LAVLRAAAATVAGPLRLVLGPPATFLPANPVVYLAVEGPLDELGAVRDRLLSPPLARATAWPFVAHVTLAEFGGPGPEPGPAGASGTPATATGPLAETVPPPPTDTGPAARAAAALGDYRVTAAIDRVHLLREVRSEGRRRWVPLADAGFGTPAIIGRGGLALELTRSQMLDPEARSLLDAAGAAPVDPTAEGSPEGEGPEPGHRWAWGRRLVVTGRREGAAVAVGVAWLAPDGGQVMVLVDERHRHQGIGGHVLAAVEQSVRSGDWGCSRLEAIGPPGFYTARSRFSRPSPARP
ncbi:MAG TPA: GNAT family N-acetyltransferase, partial [Acidimicrobiales bacterium]